MSKKSWESRRNNNKGPEVPKKKTNTEGVATSREKPGKSVKEPNTAITIDFGEHAAILREIEKLSAKELRPVDMQMVYMLRNCLKDTKEEEEEEDGQTKT